MRLIGLTGGIASGKSTVARMLVARGAVLVDADEIAREVVEPGMSAHSAIVERFGPGVLTGDGSLDRPKLASLVFADAHARADLNAITHPEVLAEMSRRIESYRDSDRVVVADIPLLLESGAVEGFDAVLVVAASREQQVERMMRDRGMSEEDALARIAAQTSIEAKRAAATHVIENVADMVELERLVDEFWREFNAIA